MDDRKTLQWLDWHIDTRIVPSEGDAPTLRLFQDSVMVGEVKLSEGEMASVKRKFDARLAEQRQSNDDEAAEEG